MNLEWHSAEEVVGMLSGAQIVEVQIDGTKGLHIRFLDERVLVIVGIPDIGVAIIQPERNVH